MMKAALLFVPLTVDLHLRPSPEGLVPAAADLDADLHLLGAAHDGDGDGRAGQRLGNAVAEVAGGADEVVAELDDDVAAAQPRDVGRAVAVDAAQLHAEDVRARHLDAFEGAPADLDVAG